MAQQPQGTPEDRNTLAARAFAEIRQRIIKLEIAPGSVVSERELAAEIGLGKVPVREALQQLMLTGLVMPRSGAGYDVAPITLRDARDVFDVWKMIGPAAAELAAQRGLPEGLTENLAKHLDSEERDVVDRLVMRDYIVFVGAQSQRLIVMFIIHLMPHIERLCRFALANGADLDLTNDSVVGALKNQDVKLAREVVLDHISVVERRVLDALVNSSALQEVNLSQ